MKAIQIHELEGPRSVRVADVAEPVAGEGKMLVEVHVAGVTFPEVLMTRGRYQIRPEPPFVPGAEIAGVVRSAPADSPFKKGDRVAGLCFSSGFGGFAELVTVDPGEMFRLPDAVSFAAGAALPINYLTVNFALEHRAPVHPGDTVLVQGAAGGVGTAAIQYAKALGATVIAVASTDAKASLAKSLGAEHTVPADGFLAKVKEITGGRGVDLVVDPVGGDRFLDSLRSLAKEGRLLVIGFAGGEIPTVKVNRLLLNNTSVVGVAWGEYALRNPGYIGEQWTQMLPLIANHTLDPPIGHRFPLAEAGEALALMDERRAVGKVVLDVR